MKIFNPVRNPKEKFLKYAHDSIQMWLDTLCKQHGATTYFCVLLSETASCNPLSECCFLTVSASLSHAQKQKQYCDYYCRVDGT